MSQDKQLEEGAAGQPSRELRDGELINGTNSVSKSSRRYSPCFDIEIIKDIAGILFWSLVIIVGFILIGILKLIIYAIRKKTFLLLCVIAIILDPLFFYIPVINDEKKCVELDKKLGITATVLRSIFDLLKMLHIFSELRTELRENRRKSLWLFFLVDILAILPIPQVMVQFEKIRGTKFLFAMTFFLLQYLLRVIRTYFLFTQATGVSGILAEATWAIVAFNLLLYMHGGHVFGALWYFYAIAKATGCWKKACINHTGCGHSSFYCDDSLRDYNFLKDVCPIKTGNTTNYNFGLFNDALQSGIVEVTYLPKKLLHCLQWGLQNVSAFGQNLQTSTDIWENIFAICMTNYGVVLFVFLIAKMQSDTARSQRIRLQWQGVMQWPHSDNLSKDVQGQIREYKRRKWQETKRVDVDNLVNDLPEDIGTKIKHEIGLELLKKVPEFGQWSEMFLEDLCDCLKPVTFTERTHIARENEEIYEMLFVIKGKLWTFTTRREGNNNGEKYVEEGHFCGEQLIDWAKNEPSGNFPKSLTNIQAVTKVEAFALMANDLKRCVSLVLNRRDSRAAHLIQSYWRFKRILHHRRNALTLTDKLSLRLKYAQRSFKSRKSHLALCTEII